MKKFNILLVSLALQVSAMAQSVEPEYTISGNDSTCQIFVYSPGEKDLAIFLNDESKASTLLLA